MSAGTPTLIPRGHRGRAVRESVDPITTLVAPRTEGAVAADAWRRTRLTRRDAVIALVFAVAAIVVRWPFIARGETLLHSDEAIVGLMAQDIAEGTRFPIYFYGQRYMGALEAYVIAALRPLFDDPITSLRLGPACFLGVLVALQYLMLTRWFGRGGGVIGAAALLAASPMFVQWSISARGGYIEILVWGTALWWAYSEWYITRSAHRRKRRHGAALGGIVGSGLWVNPTIAVFIAPMVVHALMNRPLDAARNDPRIGGLLDRADRAFPRLPLLLPLAVLAALLLLNAVFAVWVEDGQVRHAVLFDLLPRPAAVAVLAALAAGGGLFLARRTRLLSWGREQMAAAGPFLFGMLLGASPSILYVVQRTLAGEPMEPTLPLGIRPIWLAGETLVYLLRGLPLLFGADATPFLHLVRIGRAYQTVPIDLGAAGMIRAANWLVLGGFATAALAFIQRYRAQLSSALRLQPGPHSPAAFLALAFCSTVSLYVMGGCTLDFTTIRYLLPLWTILPGLLAAVFVSSEHRRVGRTAVCAMLLAWTIGQVGLFAQLGRPHPLRNVATALEASSAPAPLILAEPLDAHLLSLLTQQGPRVGEFQSFWPRLSHFRNDATPAGAARYLVHARDVDWTADWLRARWPGSPPPETSRFLWPRLRQVLQRQPELVLSREQLPDGYELWTLGRPLVEQTAR